MKTCSLHLKQQNRQLDQSMKINRFYSITQKDTNLMSKSEQNYKGSIYRGLKLPQLTSLFPPPNSNQPLTAATPPRVGCDQKGRFDIDKALLRLLQQFHFFTILKTTSNKIIIINLLIIVFSVKNFIKKKNKSLFGHFMNMDVNLYE